MSTDTDTGKEAFDAYAEIALRYAASARSLPAQIDITPTRTLICFEVLGVALALFIEEMQELLEVPGCTRLPRVRPWVKGVANVRGKLVPVVDFPRFLGGNLTAPPRQQRVLLVERKGVAAGLIVDAVLGMKHFRVDAYSNAKEGLPEALAGFVPGSFNAEGRTWFLFRPDLLVEDNGFLGVAA